MSAPRELFKPESPLAGLMPAAQAAAAAALLSSHLFELRKLSTLDLAATIDELENQLSKLADAEIIWNTGQLAAEGINLELARTRMQNCLSIARAIRRCLAETETIELATVQSRPARKEEEQRARRLAYLISCGREDQAREEGLI
jgi:hypothetical protein